MSVLSKTRVILGVLTVGPHSVGYVQRDEETDRVTRSLTLDRQTFEDLGSPSQITVTIEPGDLLNEERLAPGEQVQG